MFEGTNSFVCFFSFHVFSVTNTAGVYVYYLNLCEEASTTCGVSALCQLDTSDGNVVVSLGSQSSANITDVSG
jgi:hypothetical protein